MMLFVLYLLSYIFGSQRIRILLSDLYNHKSVNRLYGKLLMLLRHVNKNIKILYVDI